VTGGARGCITLLLALLTAAQYSYGQDLEPRSYTNVPTGQNYLVLGYAYSEGELSPTPSSPLQDAELEIDTQALGYSRTFALAGDAAKFDLVSTRICFDGSATFEGQFVEGQRCEYGDPHAKLTWNFYGAPALSIENFSRWEPGLVAADQRATQRKAQRLHRPDYPSGR